MSLATIGGVSEAQTSVAISSGSQRASRSELALRKQQIERQLDGSVRGKERERYRAELSEIDARLSEGDFRVGDQFVVTTTHVQAVRVDTATVREGLVVTFANLPDMSVRQVLRSELLDSVEAHVSKYLRNATVRTNVLTRITIIGAVGRPGNYLASPDRPVSELLMLAGGPAPEANVNELEVRRSGRVLVSSKDSKRIVKEGRTIEQIGIQSGDEVRIPARRRINWQAVLSIVALATSLTFAFIQFLQFYYSRNE